MYRLINRHVATLVDHINTIDPRHVMAYDWLMENISQVTSSEYQNRYRDFWAMYGAFLNPPFYTIYFAELNAAISKPPTLRQLAEVLYNSPANSTGDKRLQFSFATKLLHMTTPTLPIYDSQVAGFFFFEPPKTSLPLQERIKGYVAFHDFLIGEYARILSGGLLANAIQVFRQKLTPQHFTDQKVVDSLIWGFMNLLRSGGLQGKQIVYE